MSGSNKHSLQRVNPVRFPASVFYKEIRTGMVDCSVVSLCVSVQGTDWVHLHLFKFEDGLLRSHSLSKLTLLVNRWVSMKQKVLRPDAGVSSSKLTKKVAK